MQIVQAVPPNCLPGILAQVRRTESGVKSHSTACNAAQSEEKAAAGRSSRQDEPPFDFYLPEVRVMNCPPYAKPEEVARLVQLLPRSLHAMIAMYGCKDGAVDSGTAITIPGMPRVHGQDDWRWNSLSLSEMSGSRTRAMSLSFQLLAAVAPCAGGTIEAAWDLHALSQLRQDYEDANAGNPEYPDLGDLPYATLEPPAKRRHSDSSDSESDGEASSSDESQVPLELKGAPDLPPHNLTRLSFAVSEDELSRQFGLFSAYAPRFCVALAQMRTLQVLHIHAHVPFLAC